MSDKPRLLVYRDLLLPFSETFVYNQSLKLQHFEPSFLGSRRAKDPNIDLPDKSIFLINKGGLIGLIRELAFKLSGYVPPDVIKWVTEQEPALVHAHFGPDGALAMPIATRLGLPLIVSFHGTDATMVDSYIAHSHLTHKLYLRRRKKLKMVADRIVAQSCFVRNKLISRQGFPEKKISIVRHGVDLSLFTSDTRNCEWGHILYVGRITPAKGLHILISALNRVQERFPKIQLTVIGDGPMKRNCELQASILLQDNYRFLGAQSQSTVKEYLERAYIYCMPSITMPSGEAETLGLAFVEAQAMGVPVVTFDSGGIPEVVVHGETGLVAPEREIDILVEYLSIYLQNPQLRDEMGLAGRARVETMFNLNEQNAKLETIYFDVLKKHDARQVRY